MLMIQASEFKAKCLALMDSVAKTGEIIVVTKNGKPVAELRSYSGTRSNTPFGLHGKTQIQGDIISPIDDVVWDVLA